MERMGDILARTAATRRTRAGQRSTGAAKQVKQVKQTRQMSGANSAGAPQRAASMGSSMPARLASARPTPPDVVEPIETAPSAPVKRTSAPDSLNGLNSDQILELPARSNGARGSSNPVSNRSVSQSASAALSQRGEPVRKLAVPSTPSATAPLPRRRTLATRGVPAQPREQQPPVPGAMTPLREIAQGFLARRMARQSAAPADASDQQVAQQEEPPRQAAPKKRTSKAKAPDVCQFCGGAGYVRLDVPVGDPSFGRPVPCQCREREWEDRRRQELLRLSSLDPLLDKTFDNFNSGVPGLEEAYKAAYQYARSPKGWLQFRGGVGCGKTHLAAAIANYHMNIAHESVFFSFVPDLLDHLRAAFAPSSEIPYDEMFDKMRNAGLVVLDDLGAENGTAWATEKLFQIINHRYNFRMPTVITTNKRLASQDERIASRLSDLGLVRTIVIQAQDYRPHQTNGASRASRMARDR